MIRFKKYVISHDGNCYIVQEEKTTQKDGSLYLANATYHPRLNMALERILRETQAEYVRTHETTLENTIKAFKNIKEEIESIALEIDTSEEMK